MGAATRQRPEETGPLLPEDRCVMRPAVSQGAEWSQTGAPSTGPRRPPHLSWTARGAPRTQWCSFVHDASCACEFSRGPEGSLGSFAQISPWSQRQRHRHKCKKVIPSTQRTVGGERVPPRRRATLNPEGECRGGRRSTVETS